MYVFIDLLHNDTDNYFVSRSRMLRHHIAGEGNDRRLLRLSCEGSLSLL